MPEESIGNEKDLFPLTNLSEQLLPLLAGERMRVRDLTPQVAPQLATVLDGQLQLVRVFFEDEDRVVLWMPSNGQPPVGSQFTKIATTSSCSIRPAKPSCAAL